MAIAALNCCSGGGAIAVLDPAAFKAAFAPNFATLTDAQITEAFNLASIYLRNDGTGPASTVAVQTSLMYQLTAHLAQIMYGVDVAGPGGIVGRVNSASEGSTSIGAEWTSTASSAWFLQTPYGANFWQATAAYRMTRYIPGPQRFGNGLTGRGCYAGGGRRRF